MATSKSIDKGLLNRSKHTKKRVVISTTSTNRASRRASQQNLGRMNTKGNPAFGETISSMTEEQKERFNNMRHNRKLLKTAKFLVGANRAYTNSQSKEARKVLKNPDKYTAYEVFMATKFVERVGQYGDTMVCIDDLMKSVKKVG